MNEEELVQGATEEVVEQKEGETKKKSKKKRRVGDFWVPEEKAIVVGEEPAPVDGEVSPEATQEDVELVEKLSSEPVPVEGIKEIGTSPLTPQDVVNYVVDTKLDNPVGRYSGAVLAYKIKSFIRQAFARHSNNSTVEISNTAIAELVKPVTALLWEVRKKESEVVVVLDEEGEVVEQPQEEAVDAMLPALTLSAEASYSSAPAIVTGSAGSDSDPALEVQEVGPVVGSSMVGRLVREIKYGIKLSVSQLEALIHSTEFSWPLIPARFDLGDMVALERSILLSGRILVPVTLLQGQPSTGGRPKGPDLLVDGWRRVSALLRLVKQEKISPGVVTPANVIMPDFEAISALGRPRVGYILRLMMNLNQKQFNPVEEASGLVRSLIDTGVPQKDVARLTTCSAEKVRKRAALFGADTSIKEAVTVQVISPENAYSLIKDNPTLEGQASALKRILAGAPARGLAPSEVPGGGSRLQAAAKRRVQLKDIEGDAPVSAKRARNLLSKVSTAYTRWCRSSSLPGDQQDDHWDELEALLRVARNLKIAGKLPY